MIACKWATAEWRDATAQAIAGAVDRNFGQAADNPFRLRRKPQNNAA